MEVSSNELIVFPPELKKMENIVFGLSQDNIQESVESIFKFIDRNFLRSYNLIICQLVYSFLVARKVDNLYINFDFLKAIEMKENSIILNQKYIKITVLFGMYLWLLPTQEAYYILEKMSYEHIIPPETLRKHKSNHFAHYKSKEELKRNAFSLHQLQLDNFKQFKSLIHEGVNPLTVARIIRNDEIEKLQEISSQTNFDINQTIEPSFYERCSFINKENVTLIDYAAFFSAVKCFKYLLEKGANVLNTGKLAIAGGNNKIIKLCIKNHSSFKGSYESSIKFHQNEIFKYLYKTKIRKDIDFKKLFRKCVKNNNYEILSYLGSNGYQACNIDDDLIYEIASNGNIFLFKSLISVKQIPKDILVYASKSINTELLKYILQQKFDINEKDKKGRTALYVASSKGNIDVVKFLLDQNGINVNAIRGYFDYGETALIKAICKHHTGVVKLLLKQNGINVNIQNKRYWTALNVATRYNNIEIVRMLLENQDIDVNLWNENYDTPLMEACGFGYFEIAKMLLEHEKIDIYNENYDGRTAFVMALALGFNDIFKLFLKHKDFNVNTKTNRPLLVVASECGNKEGVQLLLEQGEIDINDKDEYGNTALIWASCKGHTEIVKLLLKQEGIDINAKNKKGQTAFKLASENDHTEIVELLLEHKQQ